MVWPALVEYRGYVVQYVHSVAFPVLCSLWYLDYNNAGESRVDFIQSSRALDIYVTSRFKTVTRFKTG